MNLWDILLIILLVAAVGAALVSIIRHRKGPKHCCGDCSKCGSRCSRC